MKKRRSNEESSSKRIKKPKKAEVNYLLPLPLGETEETLERERLDLLKEIKTKNNGTIIHEKMEKSFEIVNHWPTVQDLMERWPSLFNETQIKEEFKRIITIHLEQIILSKLDRHTTKLVGIFQKGGVAGMKIRPMLDSLSEQHIEGRRDIIIRCLIEYLGEFGEELIKDYQKLYPKCELCGFKGCQPRSLKEDGINHVMNIVAIHPDRVQKSPSYASVIVEGKEVLEDCRSVANACLLLIGIIYAVNLTYPPKLKYTFEVFKKLFLELDNLKMCSKIQALNKKRLC